MRKFLFVVPIIFFAIPVNAVTTRMFRVLDTCARYRISELNAFEAIEKLKLDINTNDQIEAKLKVKRYCSVFTPNEKIEY